MKNFIKVHIHDTIVLIFLVKVIDKLYALFDNKSLPYNTIVS